MKSSVFFIYLVLAFFSVSSFASGAKIESVKFNKNKSGGELKINMAKGYKGMPVLNIKKNILQVSIPKSYVWPKIEKKATLNKKFDTQLIAYQFNDDVVRFRAIFPKNITQYKDKFSLSLTGDQIKVNVPSHLFKKKNRGRSPAIVKQKHDKYDESYLNNLFKDQKESEKVKAPSEAEIKKQLLAYEKTKTKKPVEVKKSFNDESIKDKVNVVQSGTQKKEFSVLNYIVKFVAFLSLIILGFYVVVTLMRKGVLKKGKLGFLNGTKVIEVLNTSYIAPKRTVSMIKAHNQVFLIGNSEKGMHFLSEITDVNGLLKNGEFDLTGSNFDTNLDDQNEGNKVFNLKENIEKHAPEPVKNNSVKMQIKDKIKNLKSLQ